jgi:hypothetical protein
MLTHVINFPVDLRQDGRLPADALSRLGMCHDLNFKTVTNTIVESAPKIPLTCSADRHLSTNLGLGLSIGVAGEDDAHTQSKWRNKFQL